MLLVTNNDRDDVSFDMLPYNSEIFEVRAGGMSLFRLVSLFLYF